MSTLLLRLAAPMQSWGVDSKFDTRNTEREPTKSGVLGLLAAALGIRRDDTEALKALNHLRYGVRIDREGKLLCDYHMAHEEEFWKPSHDGKYSHVTYRYYLCDAVFICGLESDDEELLKEYEYALKHPAFPLFLGRRSCPPTLPLVLGIRDMDLDTVLQTEPLLIENPDANIRIVKEADRSDRTAGLSRDVPVSFSPLRREFEYRRFKEMMIPARTPAEPETEHDAFSVLEV